ncbi:unnamed protein product [marine sediment metagenome]|uniref:Uncharacterized protein n=1 Tax=marine sediment metagenome TaxID=412755 RepID=X0TP14_9ZZZZ
MSKIPNIRGLARKKPICYDPNQDRFITIDDIIEGKARIVSIDQLTPEEQKCLVIKRNKVGEEYTVQTISGPPRSREEVIKEIEAETEFGQMTVQAEIMYLKDLIERIKEAL